MSDTLRVHIGDLELKNPIMSASGTFEYDPTHLPPFDVNRLGALVPKSITWQPQVGNPPSRLAETPSGLINSIGIPSAGIEAFVRKSQDLYGELTTPIVISVAGYSPQEYADLTDAVSRLPFVAAIELNLSCPNLDSHVTPAQDAVLLADCVCAARQVTEKPLWAKLAPGVPSIAQMAQSAKDAGADAVVAINTLRSMAIDVTSRRAILGHNTGGLSGPAIRPVALAMVWDICQTVDIPVIGVGGIQALDDVLMFLMAGAHAVQIGTATFRMPNTMINIIDDLEQYLTREGLGHISDLIGIAKPIGGS